MVMELFYHMLIWWLYSCILFYILVIWLLFLNFYRKSNYSHLSMEIISLVIFLIITGFGLVIISWSPAYRFLPGLPVAMFSFFIAWVALQKYSYIFRSEKYRLSCPWFLSVLLTALIVTLSGAWASGTHSLALVNLLLSLWPFKINIEPALLNGCLRKMWHILIYSALYLVWFRALFITTSLTSFGAAVYSLGLCLLVGLFDEIHQSMVPGREGQIQDLALDLGAAGLMALATQIFGFVVRRGNLTQSRSI
jgi:VanZ family protein